MENPQILQVDGNQFKILDSTLYQHDWIIQLTPEHEQFFSSIKNQAKQFTLDRLMAGYVLKTEIHNFNHGNPQLQVQIRRSGW
jgi:hypothetical protein